MGLCLIQDYGQHWLALAIGMVALAYFTGLAWTDFNPRTSSENMKRAVGAAVAAGAFGWILLEEFSEVSANLRARGVSPLVTNTLSECPGIAGYPWASLGVTLGLASFFLFYVVRAVTSDIKD